MSNYSSESERSSINSDGSGLSDISDDEIGRNDGFMPQYDPDIEPEATLDEAREFRERRVEQENARVELTRRFNREVEVNSWCKCSRCSLELVIKPEECQCCVEINECVGRMEQAEENSCITIHEAFERVCLDSWVLEVAALGLKTRAGKLYTELYNSGTRSRSELLRAVSYRQFVRFVWGHLGCSNRFPLPSCCYNIIRGSFKSDEYTGFEDEEEESTNEDNGENIDEDNEHTEGQF